MPYIGYFQLIREVDKYIVYDDVNYIKKGWINRNNILENGSAKLFTISLKEASQNKLINEIEIVDDFSKFKKKLQYNYSKAPYYNETYSMIERIVDYPDKNLSRFIINSLREILAFLNIDTEILISSELTKDNSLKGKDKIIQINKILKSNTYVNAIGGQELYNNDEFETQGIKLNFLRSIPYSYPQFKDVFIPNLSIIDILMFNSQEEIKKILNSYELV